VEQTARSSAGVVPLGPRKSPTSGVLREGGTVASLTVID
jgi:hypothetical protein